MPAFSSPRHHPSTVYTRLASKLLRRPPSRGTSTLGTEVALYIALRDGAMAGPPPRRIRTEGFAGYSVAFSPFFPDKLAAATAANFGLVGNGRLHIIDAPPLPSGRPLSIAKAFDTQDGLYDVAWSEIHENQLVTASGDGSIKLWDTTLKDFPIRSWNEHHREVFCLDWNNLRKDLFASSSWDHTVKLWTPERPSSILTIPAHPACVYSARFSPSSHATLASCSSDGTLKIWDTSSPPTPPLTIPAHSTEVLGLDWNKYSPYLIATASVDKTLGIHDIRMASSSPDSSRAQRCTVATLLGHEYAVRKVQWSPHSSTTLASSGYDMSARIWSTLLPQGAESQVPALGTGRLERIYDCHREFVVGLGWSLYEPGEVATASWDQEVHLWMA